jgi:hypothetical protein
MNKIRCKLNLNVLTFCTKTQLYYRMKYYYLNKIYFKRGCSYIRNLKPNFIEKSNIIAKIRFILNVYVFISEN